MNDKTKVKLSIFAVQFVICIAGLFLISDIYIASGVLCLIWSNNLEFKKKKCVSDI